MKKLFCVLVGLSTLGVLAGTHSIIPQPERMEATGGEYALTSLTLFAERADWQTNLAEMVTLKLGVPTGMKVQTVPRACLQGAGLSQRTSRGPASQIRHRETLMYRSTDPMIASLSESII